MICFPFILYTNVTFIVFSTFEAVHTEAITSCTISSNHKYLLTTSQDTHCRVWIIRGGNGEFVQGKIENSIS